MPSAPTSKSAVAREPSAKNRRDTTFMLLASGERHASAVELRREGMPQGAIDPVPGGGRFTHRNLA